MLRCRSHCKFRDEWSVEIFFKCSASPTKLMNVLEYLLFKTVCKNPDWKHTCLFVISKLRVKICLQDSAGQCLI